ncbi:hypothetical protein MHBO_005049 [Bonamia ostreae]|uniref:Uncharacterized protein n=1 Tax=Bonamia ostreae TaxID=126728 RepID=A0ABV2AUZ0_9EUKA
MVSKRHSMCIEKSIPCLCHSENRKMALDFEKSYIIIRLNYVSGVCASCFLMMNMKHIYLISLSL